VPKHTPPLLEGTEKMGRKARNDADLKSECLRSRQAKPRLTLDPQEVAVGGRWWRETLLSCPTHLLGDRVEVRGGEGVHAR
jgi:hypothetical protein